jgi:hypothetical protein
MPVLPRLVALFEKNGIGISTGLSPWQFDDFPLANFTWFIKGGRSLTEGLGIAPLEIYFLECLLARLQPRTIFAIGNSTGWSSLALALIAPQARTVAIDAGFDRHSLAGIDFTNRIAREERLGLVALKAVSPQDVAATARAHLPGPIEFAFVDGYHSNEQVVKDFEALRAAASPSCVYLFHDVHDLRLTPGLEEIARRSGLAWALLRGTPSGMALVYDTGAAVDLADIIAAFRSSPEALALMEREMLRWKHRRAFKLGRSLARRVATLRRLLAPR